MKYQPEKSKMMPTNILFISHRRKQCGVHEFGKNIADVLKRSARYNFIYEECESLDELHEAIRKHAPSAIIYNYYPSTLPWLAQKIIHNRYRALNRDISVPQIGIMHEVTQQRADDANDLLFDYHIAPDPSLLLKNPAVFKTGRLIPRYNNTLPMPQTPVIGSFGFATPNKGFEKIVEAVQNEFDEAVIRFNIPAADFGDPQGNNAKVVVEQCRQMITKPGISLHATHDFMSQRDILDFLAGNTLNIFLYQDKGGRGLSSTVDYALAVDRPLAVSDSTMFRHVHQVQPSIIYGRSSLKDIIAHGTAPLKRLQQDWDDVHLTWEYERIMTAIFKKEQEKKAMPPVPAMKKITSAIRRTLGMERSFTWLRNTEAPAEDVLTQVNGQSYTPVILPPQQPFNRILDNKARAQYKPAIDKLFELVPVTMSKKIPEANVQQGFVFDTVFRFLGVFKAPRILCVGSYEDTAAMGLRRLGYDMEEIDPVLNYSLQEYFSRPGTEKNAYDIIFSTSVIEHDPDDESFVKCIAALLSPGGIAVITCDYNDQWKPGDPKPGVDARLYTQRDLRNRLLPLMERCRLVDEAQWDCPHPDFNYLGKYQYSFAGFVVQKSKA